MCIRASLGPGSTRYESLWDPGQLDMHAGKPRTLPLDPGFMAALPLDPGFMQPHVQVTWVLTGLDSRDILPIDPG